MAKQLVPLAKFRNTLLLEQRLTMRDNGWPIMPTQSGTKKGCFDWPRIPNDRKAIEAWHLTRGGMPRHESTSLRMEGDWFVVDIDVTDEAAVEELLARWYELWPHWFGYCLERHSGGIKLALFGRISEAGLKSPSSIVYVGGHKVEFHLGGSVRHLVLLGMHPSGKPYGWANGFTPLNVRHADLPVFDAADLGRLRAVTAEVLDRHFERVTDQQSEYMGAKVHDLTPETVFILTDGTEMTCAQLVAELGPGDELRGILGGRNAWGASDKKDHCNAKLNMWTGGLQIHDWSDETTHFLPKPGLELTEAEREALKAAVVDAAEDLDDAPVAAADTGAERNGGRLFYTDLVGHSPSGKFIFRPTGELWPSVTIDKILPKVVIAATGDDGKPIKMPASTYVMKTNAVAQLTWLPGMPEMVEDAVMLEGGLTRAKGKRVYNLYRGPLAGTGNAAHAQRWIEHVRMVYPDEAAHIIAYLGFCAQYPGVKVNHGMLLGGAPGIGKDTILAPVRAAVGPWNCQDVRPAEIADRFNKWQRCVFLRVNEMHDLGSESMYSIYERLKVVTAAPPEVLRINEKNLGEYYIQNVCKVVMTSNYRENGIYLPAEDRRTFVAWSALEANAPGAAYFDDIYAWLASGGTDAVVAYLRQMDLSQFRPAEPPRKTDAFWSIVNANRSVGDSNLDDLIAAIVEGNGGAAPVFLTIRDMELVAAKLFLHEVGAWLADPKHRRHVPASLERLGFVEMPNPHAADKRWRMEGRKQVVYRHTSASVREAEAALRVRIDKNAAGSVVSFPDGGKKR